MLKYFVFNLYLVFLAWQVLCDEPSADGLFEIDEDGEEVNQTDSYVVPQLQLIQVRLNSKSYTLNPAQVNWHSARELCAAQNQVLASVRSIEETQTIIGMLAIYGYYYYDEAKYWIGGSQLGHIGQWSWVSTGRPLLYANWRRNPLEDYYSDKHCMAISSDGRWESNDCDLKRSFICEDLPACQ